MKRRSLHATAAAMLLCANVAYAELSLEVLDYKVASPSSHAFFTNLGMDSLADFVLIDGNKLTLYNDLSPQPTLSIDLPDAVSAIDFADLDNDGVAELIAFSERDVILYRIKNAREAADPEILFQLDSPVITRGNGAFPQVIAIDYEGAKAIAVPKPKGIVLYDLQGKQVARFPIVADETSTLTTGKSFDTWHVNPTQSAPPGALELRLRSYTQKVPEMPEGIAVSSLPSEPRGKGTVLQARQAYEEKPSRWPWFPLNYAIENSPRVYYAFAPPRRRSTMLSMRVTRPATRNSTQPGFAYPKRRYPGILVIPRNAPPDFDADGYSDLLLWNTRLPGASLGELTRAAERLTWPVTLTIHLYSSTAGLYKAQPQWRVETQVPIPNILYPKEGTPLRHLTLRDINADDHTDVLYSPAPAKFTLWMPALGNAKPQTVSLASPIANIQQSVPDLGDGRAAILLRTQTGFSLVLVKSQSPK